MIFILILLAVNFLLIIPGVGVPSQGVSALHSLSAVRAFSSGLHTFTISTSVVCLCTLTTYFWY